SPTSVLTAILCREKEYVGQGPIYIGTVVAGNLNFEPYPPIFRILPIILMLGVIWSLRLPVSINAQQDPAVLLTDLLIKAETSRTITRWEDAASYYEQALDLVGAEKRDDISQQIRWCRVQQAVKDRYLDGSLADYAGVVKTQEAAGMLTETMELVQYTYYEKIDPAERLISSLYYLEAALQNKTFQGYFSVEQASASGLLDEISRLRRQFETADNLTEQEMIEALESLVEPSIAAGLGGGWPAMEMAYAYVNELDKYSYMLSPNQFETLCDQLNGYYIGIGVELVFEGRFPTVFDVIANGPAARNGMRPGDVLVKAGSVSLQDKSIGEVGKLLTGATETEVEIAFRRVGQERTIKVKRKLVSSSSVRYARLFGVDDEIGYVRIASFDNKTALELKHAVDELRVSGAKSLLIDLRCNGGGVMTAAIDAVRLFVKKGRIVTVHRTNEITQYEADGTFDIFDMPLAVLVDKNTASAAEIFAAAVQDHGRGVLIGQKTLGKGVVQTLYPMDHCPTGLCITTATYLPPSDKSFNLEGIEPDILVVNPNGTEEKVVSMAVLLQEDDLTMQAGLRTLKNRL
ncbi:MAG: PDZ domain-containing protein, partial [Planctomycetes bacterium]|nr:PDZ domain-containing protein [Planctomycetota bacterium]